MYSVVLADDERWILESLKAAIDWRGYGFEIVGQAYNGPEALQLILEKSPDAAFIDIRMPGMSGLEVIRRLHEAGLHTKCVIASGYAEFEYAKQALQFGVTEYCLKPFGEEELSHAIVRLRDQIEQAKQALSNDLFVFLQEYEAPSEAEVIHLLQRIGLAWDKEQGMFLLAVRSAGGNQPFSEARRWLSLRIGKEKMIYLLPGSERTRVISDIRAYAAQAQGIGISQTFTRAEQIRERVDEAVIASYHRFFSENSIMQEGIKQRSAELDPDVLQAILLGMERRDRRLIRHGLDAAVSCFRKGRYDMRHAFRLYNLLMSLQYRTDPDSTERYAIGYDELLIRYSNVYDMIDQIRLSMDMQRDEGFGERDGEELLPQIEQYILKHYQEPLSIQEISKRFFLHPNYISQLFKKKLGVNFTKYVTDLRMKHACHLIRTTTLTIGEIAERTGYSDYFYFARTFKKHMGITPTEYRKLQR